MMFGQIAPAYSMGNKRPPPSRWDTPGPGNYESPRAFFNETTKFSFSRSPRKGRLNHSVPGPGEYNAYKSFYQEARTTSFSRTSRMRMFKSTYPGPGSYDFAFADKPSPPKYKFGSTVRLSFRPTPYPGPGSYQLPLQGRRERDPMMTPRLGSVFKNMNPGPGHYYIPSTIGIAGLKSRRW